MAEVIANLDSSARIPPRADATPAITPSESDLHETPASQPPLKMRRSNPRPGVLIREQAQDIQYSSAPGVSSTPQHAHDVASERLDRFLAQQDSDPAPRGKGVYIGAGSSGGVDPLISELRAEIGVLNQKIIEKDILIGTLDVRVSDLEKENLEKSAQISVLQLNFGALSAGYFDLKNKLISEFGDKFKTSSGETSAVETSPSAPAQSSQQDPLDDPPPVRTTHIVDRFEVEPAQANPRVTLKLVQRRVSSQKKGKWLFMKNSDKNVRGNQPQLTVTDLQKKRFGNKYGDRSGILMWGFHDKLNIWVVKRKSGNTEHYKHKNDFSSWTRVDLTELSKAPSTIHQMILEGVTSNST
ncbi:unnamed protein product [Lactuca virosa]|uniref:Uncharacterized protein n=1 Tax=Lactuca virosa TaxID=75947 RepID=A0AAU9N2Y3_9ASTR|nr:unnamed protein product [Lactuca virosa]